MRHKAVGRPTTAVVGQTKEGRQAQGVLGVLGVHQAQEVRGGRQGQARGACQAQGRRQQAQGQAQP